MKILYVLSGTNLSGGATKSFLSLVSRVSSSGNEIAVVVPNKNGITHVLEQYGWKVFVTPYVFNSLPVITFSIKDILKFLPRLLKGWLINSRAKRLAYEFAKEFSPDIIHENTSVTDIGYYISKKLEVPEIIHIREYGWKDFHILLPTIKRRLRSDNTYIITITSDLASYRCKNLRTTKYKVIYNGIVSDDMILDVNKGDYFLYAGRIEAAKGLSELVSSYLQYVKVCKAEGLNPLRLKIAGRCSNLKYLQNLKNLTVKENIADYIDWLGEIQDVRSLYSKAVATVIPSKNEGFGRVMPEAIACGSLCIVHNEGGLAEQLENGKRISGGEIGLGYKSKQELTELLLDVSNVWQLGKMFDENSFYKQMIIRGQETVMKLYTSQINALDTIGFYNEILKENILNRKEKKFFD